MFESIVAAIYFLFLIILLKLLLAAPPPRDTQVSWSAKWEEERSSFEAPDLATDFDLQVTAEGAMLRTDLSSATYS